jgi:acyl-CoA hydrolase
MALPFAGKYINMAVSALSSRRPDQAVKIMEFRTRKVVTPKDLNPHGTLFGGRVLEWIDEEAFIFAACQLGSTNLVTKLMSTVDFVSSAHLGEIVEIGCEVLRFGSTSITVSCQVRNKETSTLITDVGEIVFVHIGADGRPSPHGITTSQEASAEI